MAARHRLQSNGVIWDCPKYELKKDREGNTSLSVDVKRDLTARGGCERGERVTSRDGPCVLLLLLTGPVSSPERPVLSRHNMFSVTTKHLVGSLCVPAACPRSLGWTRV